ncbi:hypothetical protein GCM10007063_05370 [Lentibacillus kapialis]|uniref:Replication-relaxation n=1 Tax=Lentibacillus kapialis TaxID=340214 RepID=A0A917PN61_9BACI|nr:replication-relaxation family protein [Lentibacillus kapialis]GGJ85852.1 hypothetical protein GCM10007063_05370 [Lentibacillus kapialis]
MLAQQERKRAREEQILLRLDDLVYATREQLQVINKLAGDRNAQRILSRMEKDKLIGSIRYDKKVYYLTNGGRRNIGSSEPEPKKSWIAHTVMRNDLYIRLGMPDDWRKEVPVKFNDDKLIPDAMFKSKGEFHFVEIDNRQAMVRNYKKIEKYKTLSQVIFQNYNHTPTLIWYSSSDVRKQKLRSVCEKFGVKYRIY